MASGRSTLVPTTIPVSALRAGPAVVAGTVRRLVFVPDGSEGYLVATLEDDTGTLEVRLPRAHARDWAPGAIVAAEGAVGEAGFAARAYLVEPDGGAATWVEVAPASVTAR